jgi:hypothetical protein
MEVAMLSKLLAGTAAIAIAGSTLVYAQAPDNPQMPDPGYGSHPSSSGPDQDDQQHAQQPGQDDDDDDDDQQQHAQYGAPGPDYAGYQQQSGPGYGYHPQQSGPGYGYQQQGPGYGYHPQQQGPGYGYHPQQQGPGYGYHPQQGPGYGYQPPQQQGPAYGYQAPQQPPGPGYGPPPQQQGPTYGQPPQTAEGPQDQQYSLAALPSTEDINSHVEGRLAALRAGLKLTPDQAKVWTPFEQASRELAKLEAERVAKARETPPQPTASAQPQAGAPTGAKPPTGTAAPQQASAPPPPPNMFEELQLSADALVKDGAAFKKLADAGAALYKSLDNEQKQRFAELSEGLIPH